MDNSPSATEKQKPIKIVLNMCGGVFEKAFTYSPIPIHIVVVEHDLDMISDEPVMVPHKKYRAAIYDYIRTKQPDTVRDMDLLDAAFEVLPVYKKGRIIA